MRSPRECRRWREIGETSVHGGDIDFRGDAAAIALGPEYRDRADSTFAGDHPAPALLARCPKGGDEADAGHCHALSHANRLMRTNSRRVSSQWFQQKYLQRG